ncbi:MAG: response regulator, partial [Bacteroidia bacterium]|nr:response regulator [Bacteroidia bacterium]
EQIPDKLIFDPTHLSRVIYNFLSNSYKYTECGTIKLKIDTLEYRPEEQKIWLNFEINDSGIGMSSEYLQNSELIPNWSSYGMGLNIAKQILSQMKANLAITSAEGMGTQVCFVLPVEISVSEQFNPQQSKVSLQNVSILVIEDNTLIRKVIEMQLKRYGVKVSSAATVEEANEILTMPSNSFDLLLIDKQLGVANGIEFLLELRQKYPNIPAVILSAYIDVTDEVLTQNLAKVKLLQKPIHGEQLVSEILTLLQTNSQTKQFKQFDSNKLKEFTDNNPELIQELIQSFLKEANLLLGELTNLFYKPDAEKARSLVHKLRGMCSYVGLEKIFERCVELEEQFTTQGLQENSMAALKELKQDLVAAVTELNSISFTSPN